MSAELPPLPEPYMNATLRDLAHTRLPLFDAKQMHAFRAEGVAAERERCARLCESTYPEQRDGEIVQLPQFDGGADIAAAIRSAP